MCDDGHTITWASSTTAEPAPPPGTYICVECGGVVTITSIDEWSIPQLDVREYFD